MLTFPDSVTSIKRIEQYAFAGTHLETLRIPASVEYIYIFRTASACDRIVVDKGNKKYKSIDGILYNKSGTALLCYPMSWINKSYTISDKVTSIGRYAFGENEYLEEIVFGKNIKEVQKGAFYYCRR